jgi:hypothetical protein
MDTEPVENPDGDYEGWVILELMGHRRLTGYLSEQEIAGRAFLRIDIPTQPPCTQFYGAEAVYCITPTTEEMARNAAALNRVAPIQRWELPPAPPATRPGDDDYVDADIVGERSPF